MTRLPPFVGPETYEYRAVCVYSPLLGDPQCGAPADMHVMVDSAVYGVVALASCKRHAAIARAAGTWLAEHPHTGVCGLPAALWTDGRCVIDDSGAEPVLEAARAAQPTEQT